MSVCTCLFLRLCVFVRVCIRACEIIILSVFVFLRVFAIICPQQVVLILGLFTMLTVVLSSAGTVTTVATARPPFPVLEGLRIASEKECEIRVNKYSPFFLVPHWCAIQQIVAYSWSRSACRIWGLGVTSWCRGHGDQPLPPLPSWRVGFGGVGCSRDVTHELLCKV